MRTHYLVWHREIETHIKLTKAEYFKLKSTARSKGIGYHEEILPGPNLTCRFLNFSPPDLPDSPCRPIGSSGRRVESFHAGNSHLKAISQ